MNHSHRILFLLFSFVALGGFSYVLEKEASFSSRSLVAQTGGTPRGVPLSRVLGILPSSPDVNVFLSSFPGIISTSRNAGAGILYWYWTPKQILDPDPTVASLMPTLGHPVAVTISVWNPGSLGILPTGCTDWKNDACQTLIANGMAQFAQTYLRSSDYLFLGNEVNSYFKNHQNEIPQFQTLVTKVVDAVHTSAPNVRVGIVFYHNTADEAVISQMYSGVSSKPDLLGFTSYASPNFQWGNPDDGITALNRTQTFAGTLQTPYAVVEIGWGTSAPNGGSTTEQNEWAEKIKTWLAQSSAEFLSLFIALDGDTTGTPCFNAARNLNGGQTPPQSFIDYLCTLGLRDKNNVAKPAWNTLWSAVPPPPPPPQTISSFSVNSSVEGVQGISRTFSLTIHATGNATPLSVKTITGTNSLAVSGLSMSPGAYDLYLTAPGFLRKKLSTTLSQNGTYTMPQLPAGDLNADNTINSLDWSVMSSNWGAATSGPDLNRDGIVNSIDFSFLNKNWMVTGD